MYHHLGIKGIDNYSEQIPKVKLVHQLLHQPSTLPPPEVEKIEAIAAIDKYQPETVITSWMTLKTEDPEGVAAMAQQANIQTSRTDGAAVGTENLILQNTQQYSNQQQLDVGGYYPDGQPQPQLSVQDSSTSGAAIGHDNVLLQNTEQFNNQTGVDVNSVYAPYYGRAVSFSRKLDKLRGKTHETNQ